MNYEETINYLFNNLPYYQNQGIKAVKYDLSNINSLINHLGRPHETFQSVHIGGTNGKGSVSHILAAVLQEAGYKTGLYSSPHINDYRERIKVNGTCIEKNEVIDFVEKNKSLFETLQPSFFEITVAMAFDYFARQQVDIAIIEVGLGGRLDSTNIINPLVSVITNVSIDHTQLLGNTVQEIAWEKAGIIKKNVPVVIGESHPDTSNIFKDKAIEIQAPILFADQTYRVEPVKNIGWAAQLLNVFRPCDRSKAYHKLKLDLMGDFQSKNLGASLCVLDILNNKGFSIEENQLICACANIRTLTGFTGRWQVINHKPLTICDIAHNYDGLKVNLKEIEKYRAFYESGELRESDQNQKHSNITNHVHNLKHSDIANNLQNKENSQNLKTHDLREPNQDLKYNEISNPIEEQQKSKSIEHQRIQKRTLPAIHFILGFTVEKDVNKLLTLFPEDAYYYFTRSGLKRSLTEIALQKEARKAGLYGQAFGHVQEAYREALSHANATDIIYIGGSTFVVGELLENLSN